MIFSLFSLLSLTKINAHRLLLDADPSILHPACAALSCFEGYSCCDDGNDGVYCCEDICHLFPETGPCEGSLTRYYYNPLENECKTFMYGGCQGNKNNFQTKTSCEDQCVSTKDVCSLEKDPGPCKDSFSRYYYDSDLNECNKFTYGGCLGNENNFKTLSDCQSECIPFDWQAAADILYERKSEWESNAISKYVYNFEPYCFCTPCFRAPKFIEIKGGVATYVKFDENPSNCGDDQVSLPIKDHYFDISYYFDKAIDFVTRGMNANCDDDLQYPDMICGGSIDFEFDDILHYPVKLVLNYGPLVQDAGMTYNFNCLTPIHYDDIDLIDYNRYCDEIDFGSDCVPVQKECTESDECCNGICAADTNTCCYTDRVIDVVCNEDNDCCDGYICDKISQLCVSEPTCKDIQDECSVWSDTCCDGICATSQWDSSITACCYHDKYKDIVCKQDNDCCDGYVCDGMSNLCVEDIPKCDKGIQDECILNSECCTGICSASQWDIDTNACCYHDKHTDIQCRNDADCCNGYICDRKSKLCIEADECTKDIQDECKLNDDCCNGICGTSQWDSSIWACCYHDKFTDIRCRNDDDCCNGWKCDKKSKLCIDDSDPCDHCYTEEWNPKCCDGVQHSNQCEVDCFGANNCVDRPCNCGILGIGIDIDIGSKCCLYNELDSDGNTCGFNGFTKEECITCGGYQYQNDCIAGCFGEDLDNCIPTPCKH
jgi:hypothetical protein